MLSNIIRYVSAGVLPDAYKLQQLGINIGGSTFPEISYTQCYKTIKSYTKNTGSLYKIHHLFKRRLIYYTVRVRYIYIRTVFKNNTIILGCIACRLYVHTIHASTGKVHCA